MSSFPKLAYVSTNFPRVAQTFIFDEVEALRSKGVSITSFAMNRPSPADVSDKAYAEAAARTFYLKSPGRLAKSLARMVATHPLALLNALWIACSSTHWQPSLLIRRVAYLVYAVHILDVCRQTGVQHVHAHDGKEPGSIAWLCNALDSRTSRTPMSWSFTIHSVREFIDPAHSRLDLKATTATRVVCICDFLRSQLLELTAPSQWHRFEVIRCGIVMSRFPRREPRAPGRALRIIVVGRLATEKGHPILIDAVSVLRGRGIPVEVDIIGDGPLRETLTSRVASLGLGETIHFHGQLRPADVATRLREADLFCLPSFQEGLPISIMEAMAVGIPVISTWVAGTPELATHRETALLAPPGNVTRLADAIAEIAEDEHLRERLVAEARRRVCAEHDIELTSAALLAVFENCVSERARHVISPA